VPEDSVRPETRTLVLFNRRKGFVGIFESLIFSIVVIRQKRIRELKIESKIGCNNTESKVKIHKTLVEFQWRRLFIWLKIDAEE